MRLAKGSDTSSLYRINWTRYLGSDPAPGAVPVVPAITRRGELWEVYTSLVTSAVVGNRVLSINPRRISDGQVLATYTAKSMQPASTSRQYYFQAGGVAHFAPGEVISFGFDVIVVPLPQGIIVDPTMQLLISLAGIDAGDNFGGALANIRDV